MKFLYATLLTATLLAAPEQASSTIANGFEDQAVVTGEDDFPTDFSWTPNGKKMLVSMKGGQVLMFDDVKGDNSYTERYVALDLSNTICDNNERGLQGVHVHPNFEENGHVFLYYTFQKSGTCENDAVSGPVNRLSRFVLDPTSNTIDAESEQVFFETPPLEYAGHNGGDIEFGNDGYVYATVGDGGVAVNNTNPLDAGTLLGCIVRLTEDGDVPSDNPYVQEENSVRCNVGGRPPEGSPEGAKCQEIFALGLRNPFRFAMDPNTKDKTRFYVNDVGQATWEEISEGGTDFAGAHYGWTVREGPCPNGTNTNCGEPHPFQDPVHFYEHEDNVGAITGGDFVPDGLWPKETFEGGYMYADFVFGKIFLMQHRGLEACMTCNPPTSNTEVTEFATAERVMNMRFGPYNGTQALYYSTIPGAIRRIVHVEATAPSSSSSSSVTLTSFAVAFMLGLAAWLN